MADKKAKPKNTGGKKVLIIEDNLFMAELLAERIRNNKMVSYVASNGKDASKLIEDQKPDIVMLDLPLSGKMDGLSFIKKIRKEHDAAALPIIVLLNLNDQEMMQKSTDAGANRVLVKANVNTGDIIALILEIARGADSTVGKIIDKTKSMIKPIKPKEQAQEEGGAMATKLAVEAPKRLREQINKLLSASGKDISIINLVDAVIEYAYYARASDIHLEPVEDSFIVRLRIDGVLHDTFKLPKEIQSGVITRIKVLCGMRTDEHRTAQDGRFRTEIKGDFPQQFDIRVSIIPTYFGENAVLRLLAEQRQISSIDDLSLTEADKVKIRHAMDKPYGMILATGPTGSGKTTTLYTVLKELNQREVAIITIEDPIEYSIEGVDQIQVNTQTGLTFATGLRALLRQDPDIIMVGEIRDEETAAIAVNAALTGHKLLSTLHTNDASTTLPRLIDMNVEPFLVASTVNIAVAQRLVRTICQSCKQKKVLTEGEYQNLLEHVPEELLQGNREFYMGAGCDDCGGTGYFGRTGIYEVLEMNDFIAEAILKRADAGEIKKIAIKNGMTTLLQDGFKKALNGLTTIEEILRVISE